MCCGPTIIKFLCVRLILDALIEVTRIGPGLKLGHVIVLVQFIGGPLVAIQEILRLTLMKLVDVIWQGVDDIQKSDEGVPFLPKKVLEQVSLVDDGRFADLKIKGLRLSGTAAAGT